MPLLGYVNFCENVSRNFFFIFDFFFRQRSILKSMQLLIPLRRKMMPLQLPTNWSNGQKKKKVIYSFYHHQLFRFFKRNVECFVKWQNKCWFFLHLNLSKKFVKLCWCVFHIFVFPKNCQQVAFCDWFHEISEWWSNKKSNKSNANMSCNLTKNCSVSNLTKFLIIWPTQCGKFVKNAITLKIFPSNHTAKIS